MIVLGIESSCDETGVAIYCSERGLLADRLFSQVDLHVDYGGVVPELASRDHVRKTVPLIREVLQDAGLNLDALDGIAYTAGPGLIGALLVGAAIAQSLALALDIPAVAVHHMEGHLMAPMLEDNPPELPFIGLLVSGGHTQLVSVSDFGCYEMLGESVDDAAGEAFDKAAKMLGLDYPGGPRIAALAEQSRARGTPLRYQFPRPMTDRPGLDFSFSGLKTYMLNTVEQESQAGRLDEATKADIARAFEEAVVDTLRIKCRRAIEQTGIKTLIIAGGVGANRCLRQTLLETTEKMGARVVYARPKFCTDNGAMIAYVGCRRLLAGERSSSSFAVRARWPMTELTQF